jgi:hypothetical protein
MKGHAMCVMHWSVGECVRVRVCDIRAEKLENAHGHVENRTIYSCIHKFCRTCPCGDRGNRHSAVENRTIGMQTWKTKEGSWL